MGDGDWNAVMGRVREELSSLASFVDQTKQGIDSVESAVKTGSEKFPEASTQLHAVTGDLENAANTIMTIVEEMMQDNECLEGSLGQLSEWMEGLDASEREKGAELVEKAREVNTRSKSAMMDMFANLSFHDLSGQKLKKIIKSLTLVENKLLDLAKKFGLNLEEYQNQDNGAQELPVDQDMVDKLLKELGT